MSKKFIIGDRLKDEWISVLDTEKKKLEFTNHLATSLPTTWLLPRST